MKTKAVRGDIIWADNEKTFTKFVSNPDGKFISFSKLKYSFAEKLKEILLIIKR